MLVLAADAGSLQGTWGLFRLPRMAVSWSSSCLVFFGSCVVGSGSGLVRWGSGAAEPVGMDTVFCTVLCSVYVDVGWFD